ncbi:amidase signature domain-containing protein [Cercophora scortea]|uniref:Amidase signature domain-containing protein n=1 Tax=Cercophora scortea TaxID=314031 RepID=A0AAE0MLD1_9PEZI|nr:amidase signature domain-containing protein [Cercophora scortea]
MATTHRRFANHPGAKEAPASALEYTPEEDKNPPMRGLVLVLASSLVANSSYIQKFFWENAKFGHPKLIPGLSAFHTRLHPNVIPLSPSGGSDVSATKPAILDFGPALTTPQPLDLSGRFYSVADYHELYKSGAATPAQVAAALLKLVRRDVTPESKYAVAFIQTNVDEVMAAAEASTRRWEAGRPLGIMDGVPFGVKDDVEVEGFVSTMGMRVDERLEYFRKKETATCWPVRKMVEAGGVMMGKMNQHEVGMDTTGCNPTTGTATNWANPAYYPGGSSSGAGSALSGGVVPIAIGTDAGGSVRIPTAFCGVYGLKPTFNRTCTRNTSMCVVGPMASTVSDLTIAYRIMAQPDPNDPSHSHFAPSVPPEPSAKKYIGICREWIDRSTPAVLEVFNKAVQHLTTNLGYEAVDIKLAYLREGQLAHSGTCLCEAADDAKARAGADQAGWLRPLNHANRILISVGAHTPAQDYLKYGQVRQVIMQHLAHLWEKYPGMLVLTPTTPIAGWPILPGEDKYGFSEGNRSIYNMTYAWYANTSGCPAITCPAGYADEEQGEGKLPVGLMAMGEWGTEEQLLAFARDSETYLHEVYPGGRQKGRQWADVLAMVKDEWDEGDLKEV